MRYALLTMLILSIAYPVNAQYTFTKREFMNATPQERKIMIERTKAEAKMYKKGNIPSNAHPWHTNLKKRNEEHQNTRREESRANRGKNRDQGRSMRFDATTMQMVPVED